MDVMGAMLLSMAALVSVMGSVGADHRVLDGTLDGDRLVLTTEGGVRCTGRVDKVTREGGFGLLYCDDGREGTFNWSIIVPGWATGEGWLQDEPLRLEFGAPTPPTKAENRIEL